MFQPKNMVEEKKVRYLRFLNDNFYSKMRKNH